MAESPLTAGEEGISRKECEPLRVLHIVPVMDSLGGISAMLMNYYRHIDRRRVQFDFMASRLEESDFAGEIKALGGKLYGAGAIGPGHFFSYLRELESFFAAHKEYRIVHAHLNLLNAWPLMAARKAGAPARISHSHNSSIPDKGARRAFKLFSRRLLNRQCTHFFACSEEAGRFQYGDKIAGGKRLAIVKNAIDTERFKFDDNARSLARARLGLEGKLVVGHIGRFAYQKNHEFIVDVFAEIARLEPRAALLLVGDGELRNAIEEKAARLGLSGKVAFAGAVPDAAEYLLAMDAFIFPSRFEGLGIALIEAQCAGLRCFASRAVPEEASISDLVEYIPLEAPAAEWAEKVLEGARGYGRKWRQEEVKAAGYDIRAAAKWLEEFYLSL